MNTIIPITVLLVNHFNPDYSALTKEIDSSHKAPKYKVGDRVKAKILSKIGQEKYLTLILYWKLILTLWWCHARDLFGSQIPVTTGGFELQISCIQSSYLTH